MPDDDDVAPRRPSTAQFGAITFERELEHWIRTRGAIYGFDLTDVQITRIVQQAAALARKRGMR